MSSAVPGELVRTTMPSLLAHWAKATPGRTAYREKVRGVWQRTTWAEYEQKVSAFAIGLAAMGFRRGDRLAIASEDIPEWIIADLAVQALGGIVVGIYPTNPWLELQYIVRHSRSRFVIAGDQEQADKVLEAAAAEGGLPALEHLIVVDMKGLRDYSDSRIVSFEAVSAIGTGTEAAERARFWSTALGSIAPDDICVIVYTSGTTGAPKGAQLKHANLLFSGAALTRIYGLDADRYSVLCYLPLCHVGERIISVILHLQTGGTVNFAESIDTVQSNICEIGPTVFLGVPRIWEKYQHSVLIRLKEAVPVQRWLFDMVYARARSKLMERDRAGAPRGLAALASRIEDWIYHLVVFRSVIKHMGLDHSIVRLCGAAAVSPETLAFFEVLGLPILQVYGLTEGGGINFTQSAVSRRNGCAGLPIPGIEWQLAPDGEILLRGPTIFAGYLDDPEGTDRVLAADGWLHTGDIAEPADNGEIRIVDRKKAIIITSGGKNIAPSEIENALKQSPYVREAIVLGDARHFISALIQIDIDSVGKWAQEQGLAYTNYRSLSQLPEVRKLIAAAVDRANERLARVESVRKFVILAKELDHDDGELTATMKVKRAQIEKRYAREIEQIYGEPVA